MKASQKFALDHTPIWSKASCTTGGNHRSGKTPLTRSYVRHIVVHVKCTVNFRTSRQSLACTFSGREANSLFSNGRTRVRLAMLCRHKAPRFRAAIAPAVAFTCHLNSPSQVWRVIGSLRGGGLVGFQINRRTSAGGLRVNSASRSGLPENATQASAARSASRSRNKAWGTSSRPNTRCRWLNTAPDKNATSSGVSARAEVTHAGNRGGLSRSLM